MYIFNTKSGTNEQNLIPISLHLKSHITDNMFTACI